MVNKRGSRYTQLNNLEDRNSYLTSENSVLKKKNDDLAKALSDARLEYQKLVTNSLDLHAKIFYVNVERLNYEECLKSISVDLQTFVAQFLTLTEQLSTLLGRANFALRRHKDDSFKANIGNISPPNCSGNNSKTAAIMPMISGHTISNPKINLPRVSIRQLTDMINTSNDEENEAGENDLDEMHFNDENELNEEEELENSINEPSFPTNQRRLETMQEEDEEDISSNMSTSLLSGIFRDVKVYISPLNTQNVVEFKKKSTFTRRRPTDNHNVSNQSTSRVSNVNPQNESLTSSRSRIGENSETSMDFSAATNSQATTKIWNKTGNNSTDVNEDDNGFNGEEDDPLEGPSSLWNNTSNLTPKSTPNETSTPFSVKRQKIQKDQSDSKTPTRSSNFVTRRAATRSTKGSKSSTSTINSACSVRLQKLTPKTIKRLTSDLHESPRVSRRHSGKSTRDRDDSPTVFERSSHRISLRLSENSMKRASTGDRLSDSPKVRRKRNRKPITYKEPSLIKKLRR